jgi:hypothetical protein
VRCMRLLAFPFHGCLERPKHQALKEAGAGKPFLLSGREGRLILVASASPGRGVCEARGAGGCRVCRGADRTAEHPWRGGKTRLPTRGCAQPNAGFMQVILREGCDGC